MSLTPEQQSQIDLSVAMQTALYEAEAPKRANENAVRAENARLEAVRLAKEVLVENARSKPVGERDVTPEEVTAFAQTLVTYVTV
jgi:hypothetical protein